jgi:hypothetical protein
MLVGQVHADALGAEQLQQRPWSSSRGQAG